MIQTQKPTAGNFPEFYTPYIEALNSDDLWHNLKSIHQESQQLYGSYPEDKWDYRYQEGKWTLREILGHLCDAERIFSTRALRISRNDQTPLPGFNQDDYVPESNVAHRSVPDLLEEYALLRQSTIKMYENFSKKMLERVGTASGWPISVLAVGFVTCGHEQHHLNVFRERYM